MVAALTTQGSITGIDETVRRLHAAGHEVEVAGFFFVPSANYVGDLLADGQHRYLLLHPFDPEIHEATGPQIGEVMSLVEEFRADEEARMFREFDWEEHIRLAQESAESGGSLPAPRRNPYVDTADGTFVESQSVTNHHNSWETPTPVWELGTDYPVDPYVYTDCSSKPCKPPRTIQGVPWTITQDINTDWSCGPTAAAQLVTFWKVDRDKYCLADAGDSFALADSLAHWMHTWNFDDRATMPWDADEGIERKVSFHGYKTDAEWHQWSIEEDVRKHILAGRPSLFVTSWAGEKDEQGENEEWHYRLIVGYKRIGHTWPKPNEWYFFLVDNRDPNGLERVSTSWWSLWGLGWSAVTVDTLDPFRTYYRDGDGDGYGDLNAPEKFCDSSPPSGYANIVFPQDCDDSGCAPLPPVGVDCNDDDPAICPDPKCPDWCNGVDDDCDGSVDENIPDKVTDPHGSDDIGECRRQIERCQNGGYEIIQEAIAPKPEVCNGLDDNCNNQTDEGVKPTWYRDGDYDGYGDPNDSTAACDQPSGYVSDARDCSPWNLSIHPGAPEVCNDADDNCNGTADEGVIKPTWWLDGDGDGYGNPAYPKVACSRPWSHVSNPSDCDDRNGSINPAASEICNNKDDNCNSSVDEGVKSTWYRDADGDGFGDPGNGTYSCGQPAGYLSNSQDCNDSNSAVYPRCPDGYEPGPTVFCARTPVDTDCGPCDGYGYRSTTCQERNGQSCWYDSEEKECRYRDNGSCNSKCENVSCPDDDWTSLWCDGDGVNCSVFTCGDDPGSRLCGKSLYSCEGGGSFYKDTGYCVAVKFCH